MSCLAKEGSPDLVRRGHKTRGHKTGSPLLDELAAAHDEIVARLWTKCQVVANVPEHSIPLTCSKFEAQPEKHCEAYIFPALPPHNIKPIEQRIAEAQLLRGKLNKDTVDRIVYFIRKSEEDCAHLPAPSPKNIPRIRGIQELAASHFNVSLADMLSARRGVRIVRARQIAMYLSRVLTPRSLVEIGRRFGGRDHTTVLHAVRKITALMEDDWGLSQDIAALKEGLLR